MNISAKKAHFMLMKWLPGITLCPRILPESTQGNHFWTKSSTARETYPYFQDFRKTANLVQKPNHPNKLFLNLSKAVGGGGKWQWRSLSCRNFPPHGLYDRAQPTLPLPLVGEKCHSEHFRPLSHISEIELACCNPTLNNTIIIIIIILLLSYT